MSKKIYIDQNSFTRTKKKLKASLEEQGISISLSQAATALAQSFGFKNEHEMQKLYFNEIMKEDINISQESRNLKRIEEEIKILEVIDKNQKGYLIECKTYENYEFIELTYHSIKKPFEKYNEMVNDLLENYIDKNKKGHFIIVGETGSGKTTLLNKIVEKNQRLVSFDSIKENDYFSEKEVRQITDIELINKQSEFNVIFSLHATGCFNAIQRLKILGERPANKLLQNTKYIIYIKRLR